MKANRVLLLIAVLLVSVIIYGNIFHEDALDDGSVKAFIMLNRYSYSSNPTAMVTITDEILEDYPVLKEAFEVEFEATAWGKVHPTKWVICSEEEGKRIEELINSLPAEGKGDRRLKYLGLKFMILIEYDKEPPTIA